MNSPNAPQLEENRFKQLIIELGTQWRSVITHPYVFFSEIDPDCDLRQPLLFHTSIAVANCLGILLITLKPLQAAISFAVWMIGGFVTSGYLTCLAQRLGGTGSFRNSYKSFVYAMAPAVLAWLPILLIFSYVYMFFMMKLSIEKSQDLTGPRAKLVIFIYIGTWFLIAAAIFALSLGKLVAPRAS